MPTDAQQVAEIAAGLTKAQAWLLGKMRPDYWHDVFYLRDVAGVWTTGSVAASLVRKGVLTRRDGSCSASEYILNPLGIALKAHLAAEQEHLP